MKNKIRKITKGKRESLAKEEVIIRSENIINKFINSDEYKNSNVIMSYVSIKNEVETNELNKKILEDNKKLVLPKVDKIDDIIIAYEIDDLNNLESGKFNVFEPCNSCKTIDLNKIDLVIVPAVAYDNFGNRIGFGKGYYDKFLKNVNAYKIGIAYDFQLVAGEIKSEVHDVKIDKIISE